MGFPKIKRTAPHTPPPSPPAAWPPPSRPPAWPWMRAPRCLAVGETVILLQPPLPLAGVSIGMSRGCQRNDRLARDGFRRRTRRPHRQPTRARRPRSRSRRRRHRPALLTKRCSAAARAACDGVPQSAGFSPLCRAGRVLETQCRAAHAVCTHSELWSRRLHVSTTSGDHETVDDKPPSALSEHPGTQSACCYAALWALWHRVGHRQYPMVVPDSRPRGATFVLHDLESSCVQASRSTWVKFAGPLSGGASELGLRDCAGCRPVTSPHHGAPLEAIDR